MDKSKFSKKSTMVGGGIRGRPPVRGNYSFMDSTLSSSIFGHGGVGGTSEEILEYKETYAEYLRAHLNYLNVKEKTRDSIAKEKNEIMACQTQSKLGSEKKFLAFKIVKERTLKLARDIKLFSELVKGIAPYENLLNKPEVVGKLEKIQDLISEKVNRIEVVNGAGSGRAGTNFDFDWIEIVKLMKEFSELIDSPSSLVGLIAIKEKYKRQSKALLKDAKELEQLLDKTTNLLSLNLSKNMIVKEDLSQND